MVTPVVRYDRFFFFCEPNRTPFSPAEMQAEPTGAKTCRGKKRNLQKRGKLERRRRLLTSRFLQSDGR